MQRRPTGTRSIQSNRGFPSQLFALLEQAELDGMSHIVSWRPHGCAFKVHRKEEFVESVLPLWFRHTNYNSFQRQLNIYGFRRFPEGRDKDSYYHVNFVRGQYEGILRIARDAVKGTNVRQPSNRTSFPDFYQERNHRGTDASHTNTHRATTANSSRSEQLNESLVAAPSGIQNSSLAMRSNELVPDLFSNQYALSRYPHALEASLLLPNRQTYSSRQSLYNPNTGNNAFNNLLLDTSCLPATPLARTELPTLGLIGAEGLLFRGGGGVYSPQPSVLDDALRAQALLDTLQQLEQPLQQSQNAGRVPRLADVDSMNFHRARLPAVPDVLELLRQSLYDPNRPYM